MVETNINKTKDERGFLEKIIDGSGAALGTSFTIRSLLAGASPYAVVLSYTVPYFAFKAVKGAYNILRHPVKNLSLDGIGRGIHDLYSNMFPYRERIPSSVGAISTGVSYGLG